MKGGRKAAYTNEAFVTDQGLYYLTIAFESGGHIPQDDESQGNRLFATIEEAREAMTAGNLAAFGIGEDEALEIVEASMFGYSE